MHVLIDLKFYGTVYITVGHAGTTVGCADAKGVCQLTTASRSKRVCQIATAVMDAQGCDDATAVMAVSCKLATILILLDPP